MSLLFSGKVVTNITCSDPLAAEMAIAQLPSSRFLLHFWAYDPEGWPKITIFDLDFASNIGRGMTIPWTLTGTDTTTLNQSDWLPLEVISFQSAHFHPVFNSLVTSSLIIQISHSSLTVMGNLCLCIIPETDGEALANWFSVYPGWSFKPEKAETWAILIFFSAAQGPGSYWFLFGNWYRFSLW